jgi:hypothetical protein
MKLLTMNLMASQMEICLLHVTQLAVLALGPVLPSAPKFTFIPELGSRPTCTIDTGCKSRLDEQSL